MTLEKKDIELIEHIVYRNSDDIAVSISRSFERLEDRIDSVESRIYTRLAEIDDKIESGRQDLSDTIGTTKDEIKEMLQVKDF